MHTTQRWLTNLARCGRISTIVKTISGLDRNFLEYNLEEGFLLKLFMELMKPGKENGYEKKLMISYSFNARKINGWFIVLLIHFIGVKTRKSIFTFLLPEYDLH